MKQNFKLRLIAIFNNKYFQYIISFIISCILIYIIFWLFNHLNILMWIILGSIVAFICAQLTIAIYSILFKEK